jgi:DNA helicase-2/ATP-dependent DNA helicase PcrA
MRLTDKQLDVMASTGHLLVGGGPGSGKTTVAILKAAEIAKGKLCPGRKILFLSFARASTSRVIEAIEYEHQMPPEQKKKIDVEHKATSKKPIGFSKQLMNGLRNGLPEEKSDRIAS